MFLGESNRQLFNESPKATKWWALSFKNNTLFFKIINFPVSIPEIFKTSCSNRYAEHRIINISQGLSIRSFINISECINLHRETDKSMAMKKKEMEKMGDDK